MANCRFLRFLPIIAGWRRSRSRPPQVSLRLRGGGLVRSAQSFLGGNGFRSRDRNILADVGGSVMPGELMGLVGGTGAGKSSLVSYVAACVPSPGAKRRADHHCAA